MAVAFARLPVSVHVLDLLHTDLAAAMVFSAKDAARVQTLLLTQI
jgi:hypothetical protein